MQIDITPFICEALGYNRSTHENIDKLYQKKKAQFYKLAIDSKHYNSTIFRDGDFFKEEYGCKVLGIIEYANKHPEDQEVIREFCDIVADGWKYIYTYVQNNRVICYEKFMANYIKKHKGIDKLTDDDMNIAILILEFWIGIMKKQKETESNTFKVYRDTIIGRSEHANATSPLRININNHDELELQRIKSMREKLFAKHGNMTDVMAVLKYHINGVTCKHIHFLYDYEEISCSIFNHIEMTDKDIDEIFLLFVVEGLEYSDDLLKDYIYLFYMRYLAKAYKQVKDYYFANNKDTLCLEIDQLNETIDSTTEELDKVVGDNKRLRELLAQKDKENAKLKSQINEQKHKSIVYDKELHNLREFVFGLDNSEYIESIDTIDYDWLGSIRLAIFGGHQSWHSKIKNVLKSSIFISTDNMNFDIGLLEGVEFVVIFTGYINHAIYYKIIGGCKKYTKDVCFLRSNNEELVYEKLMKMKK